MENDNLTRKSLKSDKAYAKKITQKKTICPYCGSASVAVILYGEPAFDEELNKALAQGEIHLGGCCASEDSPKHHCNDCKKDF